MGWASPGLLGMGIVGWASPGLRMNEPFFSFQSRYMERIGQVHTSANLYGHGIDEDDDDDDDGSSINLDRSTGHLPNVSRVSPSFSNRC